MQLRIGLIVGFIHFCFVFSTQLHAERVKVNAIYVPLADHYAAIVAFEKYAEQMKYADFSIQQMKNWDLLKTKFLEGNTEIAFAMAPLALNMFTESPIFKWIGLMHRDGNGLAINNVLANQLELPDDHNERKPSHDLAQIVKSEINANQRVLIGVPHLQSSHAVILFHYLKNNNLLLSFKPNFNDQVLAIAVNPAESLNFLRGNNNLNRPVAIEQSLPWIDVAESQNVGKVAWYSKDVLNTQNGHVECIALATNIALETKSKAIKEVFSMIKKAGKYIEEARNGDPEKLNEIIKMVQKHIPAHTTEAIRLSLDPTLRVINYEHLDIDKPGLKLMMNLGLESGTITSPVNINNFAAKEFDTLSVAGNDEDN
ncbi:ABC transporter substrate-binding protein [Psychrosphaera algicola]|uniref:ABC transporter substrate-binding protein n=1 Tax=Psychrosphaera algicola TaxID=3023714 RepID=A0ABT5F865_9GAMM|nr:ABC transporter substrate-binding protein [Psychrosphaera sp. G1-22]MDC2887733.1 ABC transporter substrate-binding protein [Psychrosphaera sp. G1-22]